MILTKTCAPILLILATLTSCTSPTTWEYTTPNISQVGYPKHPAFPALKHNYYKLEQIYAVKPIQKNPQLWLNFTAKNNQNKNINHLNLNYTIKLNPKTGNILAIHKKHPEFHNGQPAGQNLIAAFKPNTPYATPKTIYYDPSFTQQQTYRYLNLQQQKAINLAKQKNIIYRGTPFLVLQNTLLTINSKNHLYAYSLNTQNHAPYKPSTNLTTQTAFDDDF